MLSWGSLPRRHVLAILVFAHATVQVE